MAETMMHITTNTGHVCRISREVPSPKVRQAVARILAEGKGVIPTRDPVEVKLLSIEGPARLFSVTPVGQTEPCVLALVCWQRTAELWASLGEAFGVLDEQCSVISEFDVPTHAPWLAIHLQPQFYGSQVPIEVAASLADAEQWIAWGLLDGAMPG